MTPIELRQEGSWEIRGNEGAVLEYGLWQYKDGAILWTYRVDVDIRQERNAVLSVSRREFRLQELDGSVTTFTRLDS